MPSRAETASRRARAAVAWIGLLAATPALAAPFDRIGAVRDGVGGVDGLGGVRALLASPDGQYVYAASVLDNGVSIFSVGGDGSLTFVDAIHDGDLDIGGVTTVQGLAQAVDVAVSPDNEHVYVVGAASDAVAVFERQEVTGQLAFVEAFTNAMVPGGGLDNPSGVVAVGDFVYVIGLDSNAVVAFRRDLDTGALTLLEVERDDATRLLESPTDLVASPDGRNLYVVNIALTADTLITFRIESDGMLTLIDTEKNLVGGVEGLEFPTSVAVSPDGAHVYVTASLSDSVAIFDRSPVDGSTSFVDWVQNGVDGFDALHAALGSVMTTDGRYLLVASVTDSALAVLSADPVTGALAFDRALRDATDDDFLLNAIDVAVDPAGRFVYVAANGESAITVFAPEPGAGGVFAGTASLMILAARLRLATRESGSVWRLVARRHPAKPKRP